MRRPAASSVVLPSPRVLRTVAGSPRLRAWALVDNGPCVDWMNGHGGGEGLAQGACQPDVNPLGLGREAGEGAASLIRFAFHSQESACIH